MEQFIQSTATLQEDARGIQIDSRDTLVSVPSGLGWFEVMDLSTLTRSNGLTVVIYPHPGLLENHAARLIQKGVPSSDVAMITSGMPSHAERIVWEDIHRQNVSLLLINVKKLSAISTLSQLVRHPRLERIILEQSHLALPYLWGPFAPQAYYKLETLFHDQWPTRPTLFAFTQPLPKPYQDQLVSLLHMSFPRMVSVHPGQSAHSPKIEVSCKITQYQKLQHILQILQNQPPSTFNLVVCQSSKSVSILEKHLQPLGGLVYHRGMSQEEKEICQLQLLHERNPILIIDHLLLPEIAAHQLAQESLQIIHWELPMSVEALIQQIYLSFPAHLKAINQLLLYTKEDYLAQKHLVTPGLMTKRTKTIYRDHLQRLRHFCVSSKTCRRATLQHWLEGGYPQRMNCNCCDCCTAPKNSSLWRNLLEQILY